MTGTPRDRARAETMSEIVRIGRTHLVESGPAALSLRAVARDLGVVSSAIYRYVRNRDELLTLLVVDAYDELGDGVDSALRATRTPPGDGPRAQLFALGRAVRAWALKEPSRYALLYGTPVPGYAAPAERTVAPGTRVVAALMGVLEEAPGDGDGQSSAERFAGTNGTRDAPAADPDGDARPATRPPTGLAEDFARIREEFGFTMTDDRLARGILVWTALFGAVSFEVFGQYGPGTFTDADAMFELHLAHLAELAGL